MIPVERVCRDVRGLTAEKFKRRKQNERDDEME